jgi:predicted PurR-regulated permease PerM
MKASELLSGFFGFAEQSETADPENAAPENVEQRRQMVLTLVETIQNIGPYLLAVGSSFLLALLLGFLIVLDLPALERGVRSLEQTKLRFFYVSAAPNVREFGLVLGRALEAQLFIALCNTLLTAVVTPDFTGLDYCVTIATDSSLLTGLFSPKKIITHEIHSFHSPGSRRPDGLWTGYPSDR